MKTYKQSKENVFALIQFLLEEDASMSESEIQSVSVTLKDDEKVLFVHLKDSINIQVSVGQ